MNAIVCMTKYGGIGYENTIPWKSKKDLQYFKDVTTGKGNNAVIMGYNTFQSMNFKPLKNRKNYVLTSKKIVSEDPNLIYENDPNNLIKLSDKYEEVYVIGGDQIYSLYEKYYDKIFVTEIETKSNVDIDTYFKVDLMNYYKKRLDICIDENDNELEFYLYSKYKYY